MIRTDQVNKLQWIDRHCTEIARKMVAAAAVPAEWVDPQTTLAEQAYEVRRIGLTVQHLISEIQADLAFNRPTSKRERRHARQMRMVPLSLAVIIFTVGMIALAQIAPKHPRAAYADCFAGIACP